MESTDKLEQAEDRKITWRNTGGSFRMKNRRIIKRNQRFTATPEEIPQAFRDVIVPAEALPKEPPLEVVPSAYRLQERGYGWFDIIDGQGKKVSETALREEKAKEMLAKLAG